MILSIAKKTAGLTRDNQGLSSREAQEKLKQYGPNVLKHKAKISVFKIIISQFCDFMILILMMATVAAMLMGETTEAYTIIAIVVINAVLGFIQEYRTERTLEALKELSAPLARVLRDGLMTTIPVEEVVPEDLILLEAGDRIPADAYLLEGTTLQVDESLLTGESFPVEKSSSKKNAIFMGTVITNGRGRAQVFATGMATEMGKIADMIQCIEEELTPLQKHLDKLGKYIVYGCLVICMVVSMTGILRGEDIFTMLLAGISLAVAAIPEGLPAIVTIALALGVQKMLKRNALIRKLPSVETLGCASVICSDKTGTLTQNQMTVRKIYSSEGFLALEDEAIQKKEGIKRVAASHQSNAVLQENAFNKVLEIGVLCNNCIIRKAEQLEELPSQKSKSLFSKQTPKVIEGDPTEAALIVAASKAGIPIEELHTQYPRMEELPFDSNRKCMSVICTQKQQKGQYVFTKGAPDVIIKKCNRLHTARGVVILSPAMRQEIMKISDGMASEALRVLGMAYKKIDSTQFGSHQVETELIFAGLQGMLDPPRKEAAEAVLKCRLAGIKPVMITGDHKMTATAIAREIGIFKEGDRVLTGEDLEVIDQTQLGKIVESVSVYARVTPKHKLMIVQTLKDKGHIVAMTGDGVNDAPAVKEADIGIAMGIAGTDVTKEASSMILTDDNFATIIAAVEEGRVIYNNIRKFIRYLLACNIGEVLTMFLGMLAGLPIPLLPIQILWVNLVTDGLPAIALSMEPADKEIMLEQPRKASEGIFANGLLRLIMIRGVLLSVSTLAVFVSILYFTQNVALARTGGFVTLVLTQLTHVFECKSERRNLFEIPILNNLALLLAVFCSLLMILATVYLPFMRPIFKTIPLTLNEWALIGGFTMLGPLVSSVLRRRKKRP